MTFYGPVLAVALISFVPELCVAQSKKIPVVVYHSGTDQVGRSIAFAFKEAIRGSHSFYLDESDSNKPSMQVHLVSLDTESTGRFEGQKSAIADVIIYDSLEVAGSGIYLSSGLSVCGSDRSESCAKSILPKLDRDVERLRKSWPHLWKNLHSPR